MGRLWDKSTPSVHTCKRYSPHWEGWPPLPRLNESRNDCEGCGHFLLPLLVLVFFGLCVSFRNFCISLIVFLSCLRVIFAFLDDSIMIFFWGGGSFLVLTVVFLVQCLWSVFVCVVLILFLCFCESFLKLILVMLLVVLFVFVVSFFDPAVVNSFSLFLCSLW